MLRWCAVHLCPKVGFSIDGSKTTHAAAHILLCCAARRIKVDACRIQKNLPAAYGTLSEEDLIQY